MNHRTLAMIIVVLPLSFIASVVISIRDAILSYFGSSHETKVKRVQREVKGRLQIPEHQRKFMCTARAPWMNLSTRFADYKKNSQTIFVGDMRDVVQLHDDGSVTVEPLIEVGTITSYLLKRGRMLATTLEIKEATIGGLAMAVGMTTASHKYGLLQETVIEYEVIMGNGDVLKVTPEGEHSDLFHALPWSHGSLCLLLSLRLRTIPVKPFVEVTYMPLNNGTRKNCEAIQRESLRTEAADFIEATLFSRDQAVLMTGRFVDQPLSKVNNVGYWFKPWFYTHVETFLQGEGKECIPVHEYIFRHDRGIFWTLRDQLPVGNHVVFRYLLGWLCPPKVTFLKAPATAAIKKEMMFERVYQDIVLPLESMEEAVLKAADLFEIWPMLVYPSRIYNKPGQFRKPVNLVKGENYAMFYDLGVYGIPKQVREGKKWNNVRSLREMEHFTRSVGGAPFLYADTFMDLEEFKQMFDLTLYDQVRSKYQSDKHFPHLFNKTSGCQSYDWKQFI